MAGRAIVSEQLVGRFAGVEILGRRCCNGPKNHQRRDDLAPWSNERSQCRPLARASRLRRQQLIEFRRSIGLAVLIGDNDPPPFACPNLRFRHDEQAALAGKTAFLVIAFCDHLIGQCAPLALPCTRSRRGSGLWRQFAGSVAIWCPSRQHCPPAPVPAERARSIHRIINEIRLAGGWFIVPAATQTPIRAAIASGQAARCYANPMR